MQCLAKQTQGGHAGDAAILDGARLEAGVGLDGGGGDAWVDSGAPDSAGDASVAGDRLSVLDAGATPDGQQISDSAAAERELLFEDAAVGVDQALAAPIALPQVVAVDEDSSLSVDLAARASGAEPVSFAIDTGTSHGRIDLSQATVTYVPDADYFGDDAFWFFARQGSRVGPSAQVRIQVRAINDPPVAQSLRRQTRINTPLTFALNALDVEGDSFVFAVAEPPAHGQLSLAGSLARYVPDLNFVGSDSFTYLARDADDGPWARVDLSVRAEFFGNGADGDLVVSGVLDLGAEDRIEGRSCADGGDAVTYGVEALDQDSARLATAPAAGCLAPGDELLLINLRGAPGAFANQGRHEFVRVAALSGDRVFFDRAKTFFYGSASGSDADIGGGTGQQRVMLQRVPNYSSLQVNAGSRLTTAAFDGRVGGVLALRVAGVARIEGSVDLQGLGFRGGVVDGGGPEGALGRVASGGGGGGGGSGGHNGSNTCGAGGLGAEDAQGGYCGRGGSSYNPCPTPLNISMCSTFSCGGDGSGGGGGGGAGYGYANGSGGAGASPGGDGGDKVSNDGRVGGDARGLSGGGGGGGAGRDSGGGGGGGSPYASLDNPAVGDSSRISFGGGAATGAGGGGGGGAGDYNCAEGGGGGSASGRGGGPGGDTCSAANASAGQAGSDGGAGGGILILVAQDLVVSGSISARGRAGGSGGDGGFGAAVGACTTGRAGAGGGGGGGARGAAGGSIELRAETLAVGSDLVRAFGGGGGGGGAGGASNGGVGGKSSGGGGSGAAGSTGADGLVRLYYSTSVSGSTLPPAQETQFTP